MKKYLITALPATLFLCFLSLSSSAQVLKKIGEKAKQVVNTPVGSRQETNTNTQDEQPVNENTGQQEGSAFGTNSTALAYTSKYDFVQGEKIVAYEDFNHIAIGDFPTRWNTNASAEIVTLNNKQGKWLKINSSGLYHPEFIKTIPENSTLEFDLGVNNDYQWGSSNLYMVLTQLDDRSKLSSSSNQPTVRFEFHPMTGEGYKGGVGYRTENGANQLSNHPQTIKNWDNKTNTFAHISLWRQGQRLRMYVNGEKIVDLPRVFDAGAKYTDLIFETNDISKEKGDYYVLGNFRLAEGAPDTRNKLMTEGKFVTRGILFDVASDKIKPESNGVLKEIAAVLKENPTVKVKIVGHTDSDGDDNANMDLSKRRAQAVKAQLMKDYGIAGDNLETDGKGESVPVDKNTTAEGKANNRRVEFIKL